MTVLRLFCIVTIASSATAQEPTHQDSAVFQRIFGVSRILPASDVAAVLALEPGQSISRDTNGDGRTDEMLYLDTAKRHNVSLLLVRVVDEDGDMAIMQRGDLDSDLYFWDHNADGYIDVVTDYQDDDGDGDLDQMGIFYDKSWPDKKDDLTVWWAVDIGDDNLLWYDVNGNYYQPLCQWRTHFSGDELFYQFRLTSDSEKWINVWEDPFAFYDPDGDQCSEVVVRISSIGHEVQNLRYSIDADNDAYGRNTHNYDFSITALPPEGGVSAESAATDTYRIRGIETHPVLPWKSTKAFSKHAEWGRAMLTWDEVNSNTDEIVEQDPNERWEGILNHKSKNDDFVQVGGPPSSAYNKRVEVSHSPARPLHLYFDRADRRYHLAGAGYGYMDVDYNFDGAVDAHYVWSDTGSDGRLDTRSVDVNADGVTDFEGPLSPGEATIDLEFESIADEYTKTIRDVLDESQQFMDAALSRLERAPASVQDVIDYFAGPLASFHPEREIGMRIQNTPAGARFYLELARDRLFAHLKAQHGSHAHWNAVEKPYLAGDYADAGKQLENVIDDADPRAESVRPFAYRGATYTRRIAVKVEVNRATLPQYDYVPCLVAIAALKEKARDFNPGNCVVVDGDFWLAWRKVPHQIDDWHFDGAPRLSFLANLRGGEAKMYYIYYEPEGEADPAYPALTRAVLDTPAYVAWESDAGAFRFYTGQFDFFGKQEDRLIPRSGRLLYPIVDVNYHAEQEWGIDALHVGKTSGLGGLTLYIDGKPYPVQSPAGDGHVTFEHRVLGAGPVRAGVEILARNVLPESPDKLVSLRCFIYAGHAESEIHVHLPEGLEEVKLAPGLLELREDAPFANEKLGIIGTWGRQGDDIGEIGLAVIVPKAMAKQVLEAPGERRYVASAHADSKVRDGAHFHYWITGTWRRGMQYPVSPTVENWQRAAETLAAQLHADVRVSVD